MWPEVQSLQQMQVWQSSMRAYLLLIGCVSLLAAAQAGRPDMDLFATGAPIVEGMVKLLCDEESLQSWR